MKHCSLCDRKHHAKGYCKLHYSRLITKTYNTCSFDGCSQTTKNGAKGLCNKHYTRLKRNGSPELTTRFRDLFSIKEFVLTKTNIDSYEFSCQSQWSIAAKLYYGDKCSQCGWSQRTCDVNHVIPKKDGGQFTLVNAEVLCPNCHSLKHRRHSIS
jgi:5-methylcytosine-specific restriction endonuclease McrA